MSRIITNMTVNMIEYCHYIKWCCMRLVDRLSDNLIKIYRDSRLECLKPLVPRRVQICIRRKLTKRILRTHGDVWPIDPRSAERPKGWGGWPDGKRFSLVLTHDVDTKRGLARIMSLAEMEEKQGFRSSVNLVAEDYEISTGVIEDLKARGFEVGLHGIHHKNPFRSKKGFLELATRINMYLKEWNVVGFRSPSMYHDLDMIHDLDIEYDASTFDTDPFEPQPDGARTIFPFWVAGRDGRPGYIELPYTLPQDFLIFILIQEKGIDIWARKLDWIARNGGMALLITHPDYMDFDGGAHYEEYPARYYEEFLVYIRDKYQGQYWHALPREVARYWKSGLRAPG